MNVALKMRILKSGKRQIQIAQELGIPEPQLSKIVGGWVDPSEKLKKRIAKALACQVEEVFLTQGQRVMEAGHDRT